MPFEPTSFVDVDDPVELQRQLLEMQQGIAVALREATGTNLSPVATASRYAAQYGEVVRIDPPSGGTTVVLPRPDIARAGSTVTLTVVGDGGAIELECVGGTVNNAQSHSFQAGVGDVVIRLDGPRGWFLPTAELSGSGPTDAQYHLAAASASLPNARVGTASTEIQPVYTTSGVVSWALRTASVVFAKLQDLSGLSVLGRASSLSGVMGAITASGTRQVLRVANDGSELEWGAPVEFRGNGTDEGDAAILNVVDGENTTASVSVAGSPPVATVGVDVDDFPLTGLADQADNTVLANIAGSAAPPTAVALADFAGDFLSYNAATHAYDVDLSSVTYTAGDGLDLAGLTFSVDVSDLAGAGLEDDGANNLRLAQSADDTALRNVSGGNATPTAEALADWVDGVTLDYDATSHQWFSNGVSWADSGGSHGFAPSFAIQDTSTVQHVPASTGVVGNTFTIQLEVPDAGITNAKLEDGSAVGQVKVWTGGAWIDGLPEDVLGLGLPEVLAEDNTTGPNDIDIDNGQELRLDTAGTGSYPAGTGDIRASGSLTFRSDPNMTLTALGGFTAFAGGAAEIDADTQILLDCNGDIDLDTFSGDVSINSGGNVDIDAATFIDIAASSAGIDMSAGLAITVTPGSGNFFRVAGSGRGFEVVEVAASSYPAVDTGFGAYAAITDADTSKPTYVDDDDVQKDLVTHTMRNWVPYWLEEDFTVVHTVNISDAASGENRRILHADLNWTITEDAANRGSVDFRSDLGFGKHPGIVEMWTGGNSGDYIILHRGVERFSEVYRFDDIDRVTFVIKPQSSLQKRWECCLTDDTEMRRAGFYSDSNLSNQLRFETGDGSTIESTDLGLSSNFTDEFYVFTIERDSSNVWRGYINGTLVATHSTNVPGGGTSHWANINVLVLQRSGTTKTLQLDKVSLRGHMADRPDEGE